MSPKRLVDGDAIATSEKLLNVPPQYRGEYSFLLTLAEVNGTFECNPRLIHHNYYSFNRDDITVQFVADALDAFGAAGMLFRWKQKGKTWGYWIGIDKEGRLPKPSDREKFRKPLVEVPQAQLDLYLEQTGRGEGEEGATLSPTGLGLGSGAGSGFGSGEGSGGGVGAGATKTTEASPRPPSHQEEKVKGKTEEPQTQHASSSPNKKIKTAKDGTPYPKDFDKLTNQQRLVWLQQQGRLPANKWSRERLQDAGLPQHSPYQHGEQEDDV